jgi:hypothetical protein
LSVLLNAVLTTADEDEVAAAVAAANEPSGQQRHDQDAPHAARVWTGS